MVAHYIIREGPQQRTARAREWKQFRRNFLFSQRDLAHALKCSLRTVQAVEGEETVPQARIKRRFRDLKTEQEKLASA
jgi:DNA-binding XRE family transcriptional regulator